MNLINHNSKVIAVDFDGTIVEHKYPAIGREMLFAFATLKELNKKGHKLLLWTIRTGKELDEAVEFCKKNGVEFYAVNKNYPEEIIDEKISRKLNADIFIDDRNVGGFIGWGEIWQTLHPEGKEFSHQLKNAEAHQNYNSKSNSLFKKIFKK
ncbi:MAG: hydrolase [Bacteroidetes bacterium]|nr:hydrolase [Bacteroidota bacterium]